LLGALQLHLGKGFSDILPQSLRLKQHKVDWLKDQEPASIFSGPAHSLQENLLRQIYGEPLPALLRYEDHNSMAWSVESRTPFMDYRLLELTMGLPERFVYKKRVRKVLLRDAMKGILPEAIEHRKDKMGFVTPEELWLKGEGKEWFLNGVEETVKLMPSLFNETKLKQFCHDMTEGKILFDFTIWRILSFGKWYASMSNKQSGE
jgi:asparagine synthase (glutamine-hydrolysing)